MPSALVKRLRHYSAAYKLEPCEKDPVVIKETLNQKQAPDVVEALILD